MSADGYKLREICDDEIDFMVGVGGFEGGSEAKVAGLEAGEKGLHPI